MLFIAKDDFDPEKILRSGQVFRWRGEADGSYVLFAKDQALSMQRAGKNQWDIDCDDTAFRTIWAPYFDLATNYHFIRSRILKDRDPYLFAAIGEQKGIRILCQDPWETLITFIISQNRNIPAIQRSVELLCKMTGEIREDHDGHPFHAFPTPSALAALSEEQLLSCRLGYRWAYIQKTARDIDSGKFSLDALKTMDDEALQQNLMTLYGVGTKVASCVALFGFHRLNAFPVDVWMKRVMKNHYPHGYPIREYTPYNGIYQQYLFAYARRHEGEQRS